MQPDELLAALDHITHTLKFFPAWSADGEKTKLHWLQASVFELWHDITAFLGNPTEGSTTPTTVPELTVAEKVKVWERPTKTLPKLGFDVNICAIDVSIPNDISNKLRKK